MLNALSMGVRNPSTDANFRNLDVAHVPALLTFIPWFSSKILFSTIGQIVRSVRRKYFEHPLLEHPCRSRHCRIVPPNLCVVLASSRWDRHPYPFEYNLYTRSEASKTCHCGARVPEIANILVDDLEFQLPACHTAIAYTE